MTDHAKTIRDALMWAQAYAPDRLAHRLIDAEESLRELLAGHAAETASLREETQTLREQRDGYLRRLDECVVDKQKQEVRAIVAERERDAAVADLDRLAEAAHDLNEYASNKAGYWQHPLTEKARAHFAALAGREGSDDA